MKTLKHFYNTADFRREEILALIDLALRMKNGQLTKDLNGKSLAMLFFNPSLRTRVSFMVAMQKLGGLAIDLPIKDGAYSFEFTGNAVMNQGAIEHVKDAAQVLSGYCDAVAIRSSELITSAKESAEVLSWDELKNDLVIRAFMKYASFPVINMESNVYHPCQGLGDAVTMVEKLGDTKGKKYVLTWSYHPKALPMATPNSQILAACDLGMEVVVAHPLGWELDPQIIYSMTQRAKQSGGSIKFTSSMEEALKDSQVVCAKSWGALKYYGNWEEEKEIRGGLINWIVDQKKMDMTDNAYFMHCLPVRRNVEVTDDVIDGDNSWVYDQAENRLWAQMAVLSTLLC
ncbi:hypothetical protein A3D03_01575 [Candidatus Gottesmanbacteria bacterium RIFCSPHIGHO2_02_FULL_40_13]|uniref:N-acetylornithine carbamoyltransferase n=1 Tax=Candidatus Gottesmanbacteria bacterium RIFCSPHIGHO2_02_FULL_40_13 TaxID=1798384 RepID=A0A1F6A6Z1_9BACT|nr:MAG: hypothetical protein A3D03_01575 [Candidatus Gottesmanbacteria bacterium RIFCSPHIGHO2_02_FULL_40_13]